jgi:hypothetical protein
MYRFRHFEYLTERSVVKMYREPSLIKGSRNTMLPKAIAFAIKALELTKKYY